MDRERDRDTAEALIEEADDTFGNGERGRDRPGQGDSGSKPVDGMKPVEPDAENDDPKKRERYGRI